MHVGKMFLSACCMAACLCAYGASYTLSSSQRSYSHSVFWSNAGGEANSYNIVVPNGYSATVKIERSSTDYAGMNEDKSKNQCTIYLNGSSKSWNRYSFETKVAANATIYISCFTSPYFYREKYWIGSGSNRMLTYKDVYYTSYYCRYYYKISATFIKTDFFIPASGGTKTVFSYYPYYDSDYVTGASFNGSDSDWIHFSGHIEGSGTSQRNYVDLKVDTNSGVARRGSITLHFYSGREEKYTIFQSAKPQPTYSVKFSANGGTLPKGKKMAAQAMTYGKSAKLRKNVFTRKGYLFAGWAVSKSAAKKGVIAFANAQSVRNLRTDGGTTTLYAVWAKKTYKVAFYANGGKGKMKVQTFTYGKAKKLTANKFRAPKGKKFIGWAKSKADAQKGKVAYKNKKAVKNLVITGKTVKLYAVWGKK